MSGIKVRARRAAFAAIFTIGFGFAIVNALSELDERRRMGRAVDPWEPWVWELSSFLATLLLAPLVFRLSQRLLPARQLWKSIILLLLLSAPFSLLHSGLMIAMRHAVYTLLDNTYRNAGPWVEVLLYEYRKDLLSYSVLLLLPQLAERLLPRPSAPAEPPQATIEVKDGSRTIWLAPAEVEWAQAAGNYVELHGSFGSLLHRQTLATLEQELAPFGFARVHRSRIVRKAAVKSIETKPSGDFTTMLASGAVVAGSRRFRSNLT